MTRGQHKSWTALTGGDLGSPEIRIHEENIPHRARYNKDSDELDTWKTMTVEQSFDMIELSDQRSQRSSTPLIKTSSTQKSFESLFFKKIFSDGYAKRRREFSGWKAGVLMCASTAGTVCIINITLTIWAISTHQVSGGLSYLYTGSCTEVAKMSLWIHLGINVMSTLLLSASNYTMQIISSPTRKEVDIAHQKLKWLDIGVPSVRNLREIKRSRLFMWGILALSSIPLHLMYNTAIFSSLTANAYQYIVVTEEFFTPNVAYDQNSLLSKLHENFLNGTLKKYDSEACMSAYAINFASKNIDYSGYWSSAEAVPYAWICGDNYDSDPYHNHSPVCTLSKAKAGISSWTVFGHQIDYCMVEEVVEECKLSFSLIIMVIVIIANLVKTGVMILTWWKFRTPTLVTIGDAILSFLEDPDPTTVGICLVTKEDILKGKWKNEPPKRWAPKRHFWFKAASITRWLVCGMLCLFFIVLGIFLLKVGMSPRGITTVKQMWDLGFGAVRGDSLVSSAPKRLLATIFFANLPQAILSFLYLTYNGLFTCMLAAYEWTLFAHSRLTLRVTSPQGNQRSTYNLQLPYYYAVPLLLISGLLHWLMSQSLFLALINVYDEFGDFDERQSISTAGYSCIAIFFAILVGSIAVIGGVLNGFRRYTADIPLVGSCSAAISASCHRHPDDSSATLLPLKWGCIDANTGRDIGHCTLSSMEVTRPKAGYLYAGKI